MARAHLERARAHLLHVHDRAELLKSLDAASAGLSLAPPKGEAQAHTLVELLVTRASASTHLQRWDDAEMDLLAAERWSQRSLLPLLAEALVLHARAQLSFAQQKYEQSHALALAASAKAETIGILGIVLACESLVLAGDAHTLSKKDVPNGWIAPEYWSLYELARAREYPDGIEEILFATLAKVRVSDEKAQELMGSFLISCFQKSWDHPALGGVAFPLQESPSGGVNNAAREVANMRSGFRECYRHHLQTDPQAKGTVYLTLEIDALGRVAVARTRTLDLPQPVVECVVERAGRATFEPPSGDSAVIMNRPENPGDCFT